MGLEADCMAIGIAANLPRCAPVLPGIPFALALVPPAIAQAFAKVAAGSVPAAAITSAIDLVCAAFAKVGALVPACFPAALANAPATFDRIADFPADALGVSAALLDQLVAIRRMGWRRDNGTHLHNHDHTDRQC